MGVSRGARDLPAPYLFGLYRCTFTELGLRSLLPLFSWTSQRGLLFLLIDPILKDFHEKLRIFISSNEQSISLNMVST